MRSRCFLLLLTISCSLRAPSEKVLTAGEAPVFPKALPSATSQSGAAPSTSPSKTQPVGAPVVTRSIPAARFFTAGLSFEAKLRFSGIKASEELVFGDIRPSVVEARPGIFLKSGGVWEAISLEGEPFQQAGWEHVSLSPGGAFLIGVLDSQIEAPGHTLEIVLSSDGGRSWLHTGTLTKIYYFAYFQGFGVNTDGTGFVTLILEDDYGAGNPPGVYRYEMHAWGASFGSPTYAPLPPGFTSRDSASLRVGGVAELEAILPRLL